MTLRILILLLLVSCVECLLAVSTQTFSDEQYEDFIKGKSHSITISSDGYLLPGPTVTLKTTLPSPLVWQMIPDSKGRLYISSGNDGTVQRMEKDGALNQVFQAQELQVQSLAVDRKDQLYVATIPDGRIYRISKDGTASVFYDPPEKYIWSILWGPNDQLYAATGEPGRLYRISKDGKATLLLESEDPHLRCLMMDSHNKLWVGSEGQGLLYRFDHPESNDSPTVIYDSPLREIKAMTEASDGSIFVASMGDRDTPSSLPPLPPPSSGNDTSKSTTPNRPNDPPTGMGEVARITPDGSVERWWSDSEDAYALTRGPDGKIWLGTGQKGRLLELLSPKKSRLLANLDSETITVLIALPGNIWYAATANSGAVWEITNQKSHAGFYESRVFDAQFSANWGSLLSFHESSDLTLTLESRTGNTPKPNDTWSPWKLLTDDQHIESPVGRYFQYRLHYETQSEKSLESILMDNVTIYYQISNLPPTVGQITIHPLHYELVRLMRGEPPKNGNQTQQTSNGKSADSSNDTHSQSQQKSPPVIQPSPRFGWRAISWVADDPNNDTLSYQVSIRGAGHSEWKILGSDLDDAFFNFDASAWPDGEYFVKVIASDRPKNTEQNSRMDELISKAFAIDNTAPVIHLEPNGVGKDMIRVMIEDSTSVVDEAQYSIDSGTWIPLFPVQEVYDSKQSEFHIPINHLAPGNHFVILRCSDSSNNISYQTIPFSR